MDPSIDEAMQSYDDATDSRTVVRHLKCWTLWSLIKTDVRCRAVPLGWGRSRAMARGREIATSDACPHRGRSGRFEEATEKLLQGRKQIRYLAG